MSEKYYVIDFRKEEITGHNQIDNALSQLQNELEENYYLDDTDHFSNDYKIILGKEIKFNVIHQKPLVKIEGVYSNEI